MPTSDIANIANCRETTVSLRDLAPCDEHIEKDLIEHAVNDRLIKLSGL